MLLELLEIRMSKDHHVIKQLQSCIMLLEDISRISMLLMGSLILMGLGNLVVEAWACHQSDGSSILLPMTMLSRVVYATLWVEISRETRHPNNHVEKACPTVLDAVTGCEGLFQTSSHPIVPCASPYHIDILITYGEGG